MQIRLYSCCICNKTNKTRKGKEREYILTKGCELEFHVHCCSVRLDGLSGSTWAIKFKKARKGVVVRKKESKRFCCKPYELETLVAGNEEFL